MLFRTSRQRKIIANRNFEHKLSKWVLVSKKKSAWLDQKSLNIALKSKVYTSSKFQLDIGKIYPGYPAWVSEMQSTTYFAKTGQFLQKSCWSEVSIGEFLLSKFLQKCLFCVCVASMSSSLPVYVRIHAHLISKTQRTRKWHYFYAMSLPKYIF